jgi:hypothetical protein
MKRPMTETEQELCAQAVRFASNILVETGSNFGVLMNAEQRVAIEQATAALARYQQAPRG